MAFFHVAAGTEPLGLLTDTEGSCLSSTRDGVSFSRQVLRRRLNERLRDVTELSDDDTIDVFCECGRRLCSAQIRVDSRFYEDIVTSGRRYLVVQGHDDDATDLTVGIYERFLLIDPGPESASVA